MGKAIPTVEGWHRSTYGVFHGFYVLGIVLMQRRMLRLAVS